MMFIYWDMIVLDRENKLDSFSKDVLERGSVVKNKHLGITSFDIDFPSEKQ